MGRRRTFDPRTLACPDCGGLLSVAGPPQSRSPKVRGKGTHPLSGRHQLVCLCGYKHVSRHHLHIRVGVEEIFKGPDVERIIDLYETGFSLSEIAEIMYSQKTTIKRYLLKHGVQLRPKGGRYRNIGANLDHQQMEQIRFLYTKLEWTTNEIGDHLGLTPSTVRARMAVGGIPRRSRSEQNLVYWRRQREVAA